MAERAPASHDGPVLLCFDGSRDAAVAIERAGRRLASRPAVVLTVCEPIRTWEPWDPVTIVTAPVGWLVARGAKLDQILTEAAHDAVRHGVALAAEAGFAAGERVVHGTPGPAICEVAEELDASLIVIGARGRGRARSLLLGSVAGHVVAHAARPVLVVPHEAG